MQAKEDDRLVLLTHYMHIMKSKGKKKDSTAGVDAQAALIEEMENLLDVVETLVVEKELRVTRSLLELPIWGSPRDLVAALANGGEEDDSD
ncbi:hypothetical protein QJS04_geneDACA010878 [Acorus gramineus]|uniref:Uncharacterized protein n=1 Tax=Acorus gramineus TaxID=55184 RepID=A0AAV9BCN9_ACOGR|nr:hypothetical protein QJS04_geneDACA010878 [Acorus gramineus]